MASTTQVAGQHIHYFDQWFGDDPSYRVLAAHEDRLNTENRTPFDNGNLGTAPTINSFNGSTQKGTLTANATMTVQMTNGDVMMLHVLTGVGGFTLTINGVDWGTAGVPTFTATASKRDVVVLQMMDGKIQASIAQGYNA